MNYLPQNNVFLFCYILFLQGNVFAQVQDSRFVELKDELEFTLSPGEEKQLSLSFLIKEGYHIQAHQVKDENLIPSVLSFEATEDLKVGEPVYPQADELRMEGVKEALAVYGDVLEIKVPVRTIKPLKKGTYLIKGTLYYQPCDASKCYYPRELDFIKRVWVK